MTSPITVDIWSDIACPWCYIGKRRFEQACDQFRQEAGSPEVHVNFHSFELSPDTPTDFDGTEEDFLAQHKGMQPDAVREMLEQVTAVAAEAGLTYRFDSLQHTNTFKAHRLIHLAREHDRDHKLIERLMRAYFTEGRHLGRDDELIDLASQIGLEAQEVRDVLKNDTYSDSVSRDKAQAAEFGIRSVPFFVLDGQYGVSGAQSPETFVQVLREVVSRRSSQ